MILTLLPFSFFLTNFFFVLMDSKLEYGFEKLHEKYLSPFTRSCSFDIHPTEVSAKVAQAG